MDWIKEFHGPNSGYVLELYDRFQQDPNSVDPSARAFFETLGRSPEAGSQSLIREQCGKNCGCGSSCDSHSGAWSPGGKTRPTRARATWRSITGTFNVRDNRAGFA